MFWFLAARVGKFLNELLEKQGIVSFTLIYILTVSFALKMLIATANYILQGFLNKSQKVKLWLLRKCQITYAFSPDFLFL